jgi:hypothetical protein
VSGTEGVVGFFSRFVLALKLFFQVWFVREVAERLKKASDVKALPEPAQPRRVSEEGERGAVRLLAVLQREGRFVDFLLEDVASFDDAEVGAAARGVHAGCRKALAEFVTLVPVVDAAEGGDLEVPEGFDASAIAVVGNVHGAPPYKGTLAHHGWRAAKVKLPELPESMDAMVVAPAEVEV